MVEEGVESFYVGDLVFVAGGKNKRLKGYQGEVKGINDTNKKVTLLMKEGPRKDAE